MCDDDKLVAEFIDFARYLAHEPANPLDQKRKVSVRMIRAVADKVQVMREALEFYADPDNDGYRVEVTNYGLSTEDGEIIKDTGARARAALASLEQTK